MLKELLIKRYTKKHIESMYKGVINIAFDNTMIGYGFTSCDLIDGRAAMWDKTITFNPSLMQKSIESIMSKRSISLIACIDIVTRIIVIHELQHATSFKSIRPYHGLFSEVREQEQQSYSACISAMSSPIETSICKYLHRQDVKNYCLTI